MEEIRGNDLVNCNSDFIAEAIGNVRIYFGHNPFERHGGIEDVFHG